MRECLSQSQILVAQRADMGKTIQAIEKILGTRFFGTKPNRQYGQADRPDGRARHRHRSHIFEGAEIQSYAGLAVIMRDRPQAAAMSILSGAKEVLLEQPSAAPVYIVVPVKLLSRDVGEHPPQCAFGLRISC